MQNTTERTTSFTVQDDVGTPASLKVFGGLYVVLWLGMLALVHLARRKQLRLAAKVDELERVFDRR